MDAPQLVGEFLRSEHGEAASAALAQQGISAADAEQLLTHAATAAHEHVQDQHATSTETHSGRNFFAAFAAGLVRGDGFFKSLVDGATASTIAAAATPFIVGFLKQKLG